MQTREVEGEKFAMPQREKPRKTRGDQSYIDVAIGDIDSLNIKGLNSNELTHDVLVQFY